MQAVTLVKTVGTSGGGSGPISVLVYNYGSLATTVSGLGGGTLFNATNITSANFSLLTTAQIQGYRVLLVGTGLDVGGTAGLLANANVGAAVNGNQVVTGLHIEHNVGQRNQFLINALQFAAKAGPGTTGLVAATDGCVTIACTGGNLSKEWLTKPGSFLQSSFEGKVNRDKQLNDVRITNPGNAVNSGTGLTGGAALTNNGLSNWGNAVHSTFKCTGVPGTLC